jgi:DNA-directed RNA polymerase specialized sigma24 family protein
MTQQEVIELIDSITNSLSLKFRFGFLTQEDIKQECFILAIDGLERYDDKLPLENFLRVHIKNRLCNLKRKFQRRDIKCECNICKVESSTHKDRISCLKYKQWYERNLAKKNLMLPMDIDLVSDLGRTHVPDHDKCMRVESQTEAIVEQKEIFDKIDGLLPVDMRADYIKMKNGIKIPKNRYDTIVETIKEKLNVG